MQVNFFRSFVFFMLVVPSMISCYTRSGWRGSPSNCFMKQDR